METIKHTQLFVTNTQSKWSRERRETGSATRAWIASVQIISRNTIGNGFKSAGRLLFQFTINKKIMIP